MNSNIKHFHFYDADTVKARPVVAISCCLTGENVRYDGKSKPIAHMDELQHFLDLKPICPEVEAGLSIPRPPVQLVQTGAMIIAQGRENKDIDVTTRLTVFSQENLLSLKGQSLCGYLLKSRSPSCGLGSTPIYNDKDEQIALGSGLQASYFTQQLPWLIYREETQLTQPKQRESFILLCLIMHELQQGLYSDTFSQVCLHYTRLGLSPSIGNTQQPLLSAKTTLEQYFLSH